MDKWHMKDVKRNLRSMKRILEANDNYSARLNQLEIEVALSLWGVKVLKTLLNQTKWRDLWQLPWGLTKHWNRGTNMDSRTK